MNISSMLSDHPPDTAARGIREPPRPQHPYPTRNGSSFHFNSQSQSRDIMPPNGFAAPHAFSRSQGAAPQQTVVPDIGGHKSVLFKLRLTPNSRARQALRVNIQKHDNPESIMATVRSFFGLYDGMGLSFEDEAGSVFVAQYENMRNGGTYQVNISDEEPQAMDAAYRYGPQPHPSTNLRTQLGDPFRMAPPPPQMPSRPSSRSTRRRETSPAAASSHRSGSHRPGSRVHLLDGENSDSDAGSASSSRRAKSEQVKADISTDNILEGGGRRNLASFTSSYLPLYQPSFQPVPASISSVSPQRRDMANNYQSPVNPNPQASFSYNAQPLTYTPQVNQYNGIMTPNTGSAASGYGCGLYHPSGHQLRASSSRVPLRSSGASGLGVLPTPDPTINSVISDEDVALQLMRLGDASNWSHGRASASTEDAVSGKAELASSAGATDLDDEDEERPLPAMKHSHAGGPARKKMKSSMTLPQSYGDYTSGEEYEDRKDGSFNGNSDPIEPNALGGKPKLKAIKSKSRTNSVTSKSRPTKSKSKSVSTKIPPSPYAQDAVPRKDSVTSSATIAPGRGVIVDLADLPRCLRCKKSKKGCDRAGPPCTRCKEAGIGPEGCIPEDPSSGRKGKYGRHVGVDVKTDGLSDVLIPAQAPGNLPTAFNSGVPLATTGDNSKKRKR